MGHLQKKKTLFEKLLKFKIDDNGCYNWTGCTHNKYGYLRHNGRSMSAHRAMWVLVHGEIPDKKHILHKCDNPGCINPRHLFIGTHADNMKDMVKKGRWSSGNAKKTHCKNGHEFTKENTIIGSKGERRCRRCNIEWQRKMYPIYYERYGKTKI